MCTMACSVRRNEAVPRGALQLDSEPGNGATITVRLFALVNSPGEKAKRSQHLGRNTCFDLRGPALFAILSPILWLLGIGSVAL